MLFTMDWQAWYGILVEECIMVVAGLFCMGGCGPVVDNCLLKTDTCTID